MAYWLMKSEPDAFSIDDLERVGTEPWDGIRNYQVRNMIRDEMKPGDRAFFYHSNTKVPGIVGIMEIVSQPRPDPTAFDPDEKYYDPKSDPDKPRWLLVDVKYVRHTKRVIPLTELKADPALEEMPLV
ncbi:MAG: EVE domain-containing protein, partial [Guyparkeria sp.]